MPLFRRTRTAAICAAVSAAVVVGMAGTAVAHLGSACGRVDCAGLAAHAGGAVSTTPRTASTPAPPATTAAAVTARAPGS